MMKRGYNVECVLVDVDSRYFNVSVKCEFFYAVPCFFGTTRGHVLLRLGLKLWFKSS